MHETIDTLLQEGRTFAPPPDFAAAANISDPAIYESANKDPVGFWENWAKQLAWDQPWHQALDWTNPPFVKWFVGGKLNACFNCVDRHATGERTNKTAIMAGLGEKCCSKFGRGKRELARIP